MFQGGFVLDLDVVKFDTTQSQVQSTVQSDVLVLLAKIIELPVTVSFYYLCFSIIIAP